MKVVGREREEGAKAPELKHKAGRGRKRQEEGGMSDGGVPDLCSVTTEGAVGLCCSHGGPVHPVSFSFFLIVSLSPRLSASVPFLLSA